jgi:hypothetical protein
MTRQTFNFKDIEQDCEIQYDCHQLDGRALGIKILVPEKLHQQHPYQASSYAYLQLLREQIKAFGTIEFPGLPINKTNYTLAQRAPWEHPYSTNQYMTDHCQQPHQDTPPYPTAFGLEAPRQYFATWLMSLRGLEHYYQFARQNPQLSTSQIHQQLLTPSLNDGSALLVNRQPGLILIDNSQHQNLYHARTCLFDALANAPKDAKDAPMYAFNEVGLLNYIDQLDSQRGQQWRDSEDLAAVRAFLEQH